MTRGRPRQPFGPGLWPGAIPVDPHLELDPTRATRGHRALAATVLAVGLAVTVVAMPSVALRSLLQDRWVGVSVGLWLLMPWALPLVLVIRLPRLHPARTILCALYAVALVLLQIWALRGTDATLLDHHRGEYQALDYLDRLLGKTNLLVLMFAQIWWSTRRRTGYVGPAPLVRPFE